MNPLFNSTLILQFFFNSILFLFTFCDFTLNFMPLCVACQFCRENNIIISKALILQCIDSHCVFLSLA